MPMIPLASIAAGVTEKNITDSGGNTDDQHAFYLKRRFDYDDSGTAFSSPRYRI
jgi:hypothetical protein